MSKFTIKQIVHDYCVDKNDIPTATLARALFTHHPKLFSTMEHARKHVRRVRGLTGKKELPYKTINYKPKKEIPPSDAKEIPPYRFGPKDNKILVLSDLHFPYHNIPAIEAAVDHGLSKKVNTILLNGDVIDMHHQSKFQPDPRKRDTVEEFNKTRQFLEYLREKFPKQKIVWAEGNHDARWPQWLSRHALAIFNDDYFSLQARLDLKNLNIEFIPEAHLIYAGKLTITHGHKIVMGRFSNPVNPARGIYMNTKSSHLVGHYHQISEHSETNIHGDMFTCWSTGCLCELRPAYAPFSSKTSHGFATIDVHENNWFSVNNIRIKNGKIL